MNWDEIVILAGGIFNLGFAVFHLFFWRIFDWKKDLASLSYINRAVMQILNLCLTYLFLVMAYISFFHRLELLQTSLGNTVLIAFSIFWFLRMLEQVIFFGVKNPLSIAFTVTFLLGSVIYLMPLV